MLWANDYESLDAGELIEALSEYLGHADPCFTLQRFPHLMPN